MQRVGVELDLAPIDKTQSLRTDSAAVEQNGVIQKSRYVADRLAGASRLENHKDIK